MSRFALWAGLILAVLALGIPCQGCKSNGWKPGGNRAPVGQGRRQYSHLDDLGEVSRRGGILDLERGYYWGDLTLTGTGMEKRGVGVGETVIDGNVIIDGHGWVLSGMTIRGDVTITGDENSVRACRVNGEVIVNKGLDNRR